jgi:translation initiation factor 2A
MSELQLVVRDQNGSTFRTVESSDPLKISVSGSALCSSKVEVEYSADGILAATIDASGNGVLIYNTATGKEQTKINCPNAIAIAFSPKGTFVQTWEKLTEELQQSGGNLRIWDSSSGALLTGFSQKNFSKDQWPSIQWTNDEIVSCLAVTNGVHLFNGQDMASGVIGKINQDRLTKFAVSPGPAPYKVGEISVVEL